MHDGLLDHVKTESQKPESDMQHFGFLHMDIRVSAGSYDLDAGILLVVLVIYDSLGRKQSELPVIDRIR